MSKKVQIVEEKKKKNISSDDKKEKKNNKKVKKKIRFKINLFTIFVFMMKIQFIK